jgi:poly(3-hydroxybutyrate) depolymerase
VSSCARCLARHDFGVLRRAAGVVVLLAAIVVVSAAAGGAAPSSAASGPRTLPCQGHCVRIVRIHYRAHNGARLPAYVVLPAWYDARTSPPLPLVISPHGRGVTALSNALRWGRLPSYGGFAVVNPAGAGRRLARFSWGYRGQIHDLARMPQIVRRALPKVRLDLAHVYAFGTSMGGQETLLLLARYPDLLAGAAAFDAVTDMARRYRDFLRIGCTDVCKRLRGPSGRSLQRLARIEVGGTPSSAPRAYASRSPIAFARRIAHSGVPLQLWWSTADRIVVDQDAQSGRLTRELRRLNADAPLYVVTGSWPHSLEMNSSNALRRSLERFGLVGTRRIGEPLPTPPTPIDPRPPASDG